MKKTPSVEDEFKPLKYYTSIHVGPEKIYSGTDYTTPMKKDFLERKEKENTLIKPQYPY